jgi:putative Mg2+ transporter-C (MgtC) family protein
MGFLGAGTIIRHGSVVRGLTTAASLWAVAAVGICVGVGGEGYWVAGLATAVVLLTLTLLRSAEQRLLARHKVAHLTVQLVGGPTRMREIERLLSAQGAVMEAAEVSEVGPGDIHQMQFRVLLPGECDLGSLGAALTEVDGFVSMRCE